MKKGFTLIELLVVMVVVTILVTVALPKYKVALEKSRGMEGFHNAAALSDALNTFYVRQGNTYNDSASAVALWDFAKDLSGVTSGKFFTCSLSAGGSDTSQEVVCTRSTGTYKIIFNNSYGETASRTCTGNKKYCNALGATLSSGTGWKF